MSRRFLHSLSSHLINNAANNDAIGTTLTSTASSSSDPQPSNNITIKIITLILLLFSSFVATLIPSLLKQLSSFIPKSLLSQKHNAKLLDTIEWLLHVSQGFAAGVLLAGGVCHMLAESMEDLSEALEQLDSLSDQLKDFPWGPSVFICWLSFLYLLETVTQELLTFLMRKKLQKKEKVLSRRREYDAEDPRPSYGAVDALDSPSVAATSTTTTTEKNEKQHLLQQSTGSSDSINATTPSTAAEHEHHHHHHHDSTSAGAHSHVPDLSQLDQQSLVKTIVSCFVLWVSLFSHSYIAGLGLGLQEETNHFISLLLAIVSHKLFAAYSLGVVLSNALAYSRSRITYVVIGFLIITFSLGTPSGIATGLLLQDASFSKSIWFQISSSLLLCCAAGAFVYISLFELLFESGHNHGKFGYSRIFTSIMFHFFFLVGLFGMMILALWA